MILDLVPPTDLVLRTVAFPFNFSEPQQDPVELARNLGETMLSRDGIGLAAPQVGISLRVFAMKTQPMLVVFNPIIVDVSDTNTVMLEGCLTFPDYYVKVKRPGEIKVRYHLPNGEVETREFAGITARVFQHELDHLDGVLFQDRASLFHRGQAERLKRARRKAKKSASADTYTDGSAAPTPRFNG